MTNTTLPEELLKSDVLGRVRTPVDRREALLDEFERSGLTGQKFAALVGVKYQTFASWIQKRRKVRGDYGRASGVGAGTAALEVAKPLQWLEAVAEPSAREAKGLRVELPGGASVRIEDAAQAVLVARLLRELRM
jgi:hypothetical protein